MRRERERKRHGELGNNETTIERNRNGNRENEKRIKRTMQERAGTTKEGKEGKTTTKDKAETKRTKTIKCK